MQHVYIYVLSFIGNYIVNRDFRAHFKVVFSVFNKENFLQFNFIFLSFKVSTIAVRRSCLFATTY